MPNVDITPDHIHNGCCLLYRVISDRGYTVHQPNALKSTSNKYRIALYQHSGAIIATEDAIKNEDADAAASTFKKFFELVNLNQPDLVLTPEYSCPWSVIEWLLHDGPKPSREQIWVIGCESIRPEELRELIERHLDDAVWCSELKHLTAGRFLDPVLYLLTVEAGDSLKHVAAIQFKNQPMADPRFRIEPGSMMCGTATFVLSDPDAHRNDFINLATIICSDALGFTDRWQHLLPSANVQPYLILHPQLTPSTLDDNLAHYRREIARSQVGKRYEFVSLNWGADSVVKLPDNSSFALAGQSAHYMKPSGERRDHEPIQTRPAIEANHLNGVYLRFCPGARYAAYYFNTGHLAYLYEASPVDIQTATPIAQRFGIENAEVFEWRNQGWNKTANLPDGIQYPRSGALSTRASLCAGKPFDRETLLALSTGRIEPLSDGGSWSSWSKPSTFRSMQMSNDERPWGTLAKLLLSDADDVDRTFVEFDELLTVLLNDIEKYPKHRPTEDVAGLTISVPRERMGCWANIDLNGDPHDGLIAYIGNKSRPNAERLFGLISEHLKPSYLLIWYRDAHGNYQTFVKQPNLITAPNQLPHDITNGMTHGY